MSDLVNYIYNSAIDYIEDRERDNELRSAYAGYMSAQNWNNNEMNNVVDVIAIIAEDELRNLRRDSDEKALIRSIIVAMVDAHCGAFGLSDKRLSDSVSDAIYTEMKRADAKWNDILNRISGNSRGGSRREETRDRGFGSSRRTEPHRRDRGDRGDRGRSVFDRNNRFGEQRDREVDPRASNSVFANRDVGVNNPVFDRNPPMEREAPRKASVWDRSPVKEEPVVNRSPEPVEETYSDGPNMDLARPYDDFWVDGENWQLAHCSKFVWSWSPTQQTRRSYNPDDEVRFLVKSKDGYVREEFITMADDLIEEAHIIRDQARPNRPRITTERFEGDSIFESDDLDVVDFDTLKSTMAYVAKSYISEMDIGTPHLSEQAVSVSTIEEAAVRAAGLACKTDNDVTAVNNIMSVELAGDSNSTAALESIRAVSVSEGDLLQLQNRLISLRGTLSENVLNYLDKHFTNEVNSALGDQFGLARPRIESFIEDFKDLLDCNTFKKQGASYSAQFLSRTRIILASMQYLTEDDMREEFLDCEDLLPTDDTDPEGYTEFRKNTVILFKPMSMVHIKMNVDALGFVDNEVRVPVRTGKGADPEMVNFLNGLYAIARKIAGAGRAYVVTADNIILELVPISGARDIVGIRTV